MSNAETVVFDGEELTADKFIELVEYETDVQFIPSNPKAVRSQISLINAAAVFNLVFKMRLSGWQFHADDACPELDRKASVCFVRWPKPAGEPVTGACEDALSPVSVCMAAVRAWRNWRKKYPE